MGFVNKFKSFISKRLNNDIIIDNEREIDREL